MQQELAALNPHGTGWVSHCRLVTNTLTAAIRLGRPQFLAGGCASYALGAVVAYESEEGSFDWRRCLVGQAVVTSLQLMTHYSNDYFDYEADVANRSPTWWSGGSRILTDAVLPRAFALYVSLIWWICGMACMVWIRFLTPSPIAWWLMVAISLLAWGYSAPPLRLHSRGVGEVAAAVVVAMLVPWFGCVIQLGVVVPRLALAIMPLVLIQFVMLVVLSVPDRRGDLAVGKNTLAVRLGLKRTEYLHQAALSAAYLSVPLLWRLGLPSSIALAILVPLPVALLQMVAVARGKLRVSRAWPCLTFGSVALVFLTTIAEIVGALLAPQVGPV